jgi:hypothetical protein
MEIVIDYELAPARHERGGRLAEASEMDLRYDFFLGDLVFRIDSLDVTTRWGWVPLIDAAMCLECVVNELSAGKQESIFEFTESEQTILFVVDETRRVCVTATYVSGQACVSLDVLRGAVESFTTRVFESAFRRYPELRRNRSLARRAGSDFFHGSNP